MDEGAKVARFLNFAAAGPLLKREGRQVEEVAVQLRTMTDEVSRTLASSERRSPEKMSPARIAISSEMDQRRRSFNALLEPHTWCLYLAGWNKKGTPVFVDMPTLDGSGDWMLCLIRLARAHLVDRLRKCAQCGVWFFALTPWAQYCSTPCRKTHFRSNPEFQKRNTKYQRNYFRKQCSVNKDHYRKGLSPAEVRELKKGKRHAKKR